jgi:RNA polymerase sigma factor (sigma-70 family)
MSEATDSGCTVFVIDDDESMRDSLALMLGLLGYRSASYASAEAFLASYQINWTGCVVADLKLPGMSGLELQAELRRRGSQMPFVRITAHGGVSSARAAFRAEAVDFLEKPFDESELRTAIETGLEREMGRVQRAKIDREVALQFDKLTQREREVLHLAAKGLHAKEIARTLGISPRTVEVHKASLMAKLGARNVAELVRFALMVDKRS